LIDGNEQQDRSPLPRALDESGQRARSREPIDILLVEDNPADVRMFREALNLAHIAHELHVAGDGEEALSFLRRQGTHARAPRPDVVVLDLKLPRLSGNAVLGAISLEKDLQSVPVVVLTSSKTHGDLAASQIMATHVITKPVGVGALAAELKIIERIVQRSNLSLIGNGAPVVRKDRQVFLVSAGPEGRWIVEPPNGSGFFFHGLDVAVEFATVMAKKTPPSQVQVMDRHGVVQSRTDYD
jgi:two-component system response regulator